MPPCGVPLYVLWNFQFSKYIRTKELSDQTNKAFVFYLFGYVYQDLMKHIVEEPLMSPSMNHLVPVYSRLIVSRAV